MNWPLAFFLTVCVLVVAGFILLALFLVGLGLAERAAKKHRAAVAAGPSPTAPSPRGAKPS